MTLPAFIQTVLHRSHPRQMDVYPILKISREVNSLQHPLVTFSRVYQVYSKEVLRQKPIKILTPMNLVTSTEKAYVLGHFAFMVRNVFTKQAIQTETICLEQMWEVDSRETATINSIP